MNYINFPTTSQRTPCILVLDTSIAMSLPWLSNKTGIDALNSAINRFHKFLAADPTAKVRWEICIIKAGGANNSAECVQDWTLVHNYMPAIFEASGMSPIGAGINLALEMIKTRKEHYNHNGFDYTRPYLFIMSAGKPTDKNSEWQAAVSALKEAESFKQVKTFTIALGRDANFNLLASLSSYPVFAGETLNWSEIINRTWVIDVPKYNQLNLSPWMEVE